MICLPAIPTATGCKCYHVTGPCLNQKRGLPQWQPTKWVVLSLRSVETLINKQIIPQLPPRERERNKSRRKLQTILPKAGSPHACRLPPQDDSGAAAGGGACATRDLDEQVRPQNHPPPSRQQTEPSHDSHNNFSLHSDNDGVEVEDLSTHNSDEKDEDQPGEN